jgi:hypothetical protein
VFQPVETAALQKLQGLLANRSHYCVIPRSFLVAGAAREAAVCHYQRLWVRAELRAVRRYVFVLSNRRCPSRAFSPPRRQQKLLKIQICVYFDRGGKHALHHLGFGKIHFRMGSHEFLEHVLLRTFL